MSSVRRSALLAVRDAFPLFLPAIPFGLIIGITVAETDVPNLAGFLTGSLIFGGAAQLAAVTLLGAGATGASALAAALVVNLRHLMYSAAMVPRFRTQPRWFRWFGPYLLIDQLFALVSVRTEEDDLHWRTYYMTAGFFFWTMWQTVMAVGVLSGSAIPAGIQFEFAVPAMFVGLLVPGLTRKPAVLAAVVGAVTTAALWGVPNRGGMLFGSLAGAVAGYLAEDGK